MWNQEGGAKHTWVKGPIFLGTMGARECEAKTRRHGLHGKRDAEGLAEFCGVAQVL